MLCHAPIGARSIQVKPGSINISSLRDEAERGRLSKLSVNLWLRVQRVCLLIRVRQTEERSFTPVRSQ